MQPKIKICGMREEANLREIARLAPDYLGFIYYRKSPRYVGADFNPEWGPEMDSIRKVAVFVDEPLESALDIMARAGYDAAQLHGNESPAYCRDIKAAGIQVIKAFGVDRDFDFSRLEAYEPVVDYFLFDAKTRDYGGSGKTFGWDLLQGYRGSRPFFLSGGLEPGNLKQALQATSGLPLYGLDLNSRIEQAPGLKDAEKASEAISMIKQGEYEN